MPRNKTITDEEILAVARSLFLKEGAKASTRTLAKLVGISEAVIFQRFSTKEDLFFTAMVPPAAQLDAIFSIHPGEKQVIANLESVSLQIVVYFREVMPVFFILGQSSVLRYAKFFATSHDAWDANCQSAH